MSVSIADPAFWNALRQRILEERASVSEQVMQGIPSLHLYYQQIGTVRALDAVLVWAQDIVTPPQKTEPETSEDGW